MYSQELLAVGCVCVYACICVCVHARVCVCVCVSVRADVYVSHLGLWDMCSSFFAILIKCN